MKHTPTESACKLFYKEHFVQLLDEINESFAEFVKCAHVHDDTARHPMSDADFLNFLHSLREFSELIPDSIHRYLHTHPEALELLKAEQGVAGRTMEEILKQVWQSLQRTAADATGQTIDNDLDQAEDEV